MHLEKFNDGDDGVFGRFDLCPSTTMYNKRSIIHHP